MFALTDDRHDPTVSDYTSFRAEFPGLAQAYCLTLVRDIDPIDLIHRAHGRVRGRATGVADLFQAADDMSYPGQRFVAVTCIGAWTLAVEPNGALGVNVKAATRMSRGTRLVSHYRNMNSDNQFCWIDDGAIRLSFEPASPSTGTGSDADALIDVLRWDRFRRRHQGHEFAHFRRGVPRPCRIPD